MDTACFREMQASCSAQSRLKHTVASGWSQTSQSLSEEPWAHVGVAGSSSAMDGEPRHGPCQAWISPSHLATGSSISALCDHGGAAGGTSKRATRLKHLCPLHTKGTTLLLEEK